MVNYIIFILAIVFSSVNSRADILNSEKVSKINEDHRFKLQTLSPSEAWEPYYDTIEIGYAWLLGLQP